MVEDGEEESDGRLPLAGEGYEATPRAGPLATTLCARSAEGGQDGSGGPGPMEVRK